MPAELEYEVIGPDEYGQFFIRGFKGDKLVAHAEGYPDIDKSTLYIKWLGTLPRYRRKGYGLQLVNKLEELAEDWDYSAIALDSKDTRARSFWAAMGYVRISGTRFRKILEAGWL